MPKSFLYFIMILFPILNYAQLDLNKKIIFSQDSMISMGIQGDLDLRPGAGVVRVSDPDGNYSDFTHSVNGAIIRTNNNIFELFIGDNPTDIGTLSIRRNYHDNFSLGSRLLINDRSESNSIEISSENLHNGEGVIRLNSAINGGQLIIDNTQPNSSIKIKISNSIVGTFNTMGLQLKHYTTNERNDLINVPIGTTIFNISLGVNQVWDGNEWR